MKRYYGYDTPVENNQNNDIPEENDVITVSEMKKINRKKTIISLFIFIIITCSILVFFYFFKFPLVQGDSMLPSFYNDERVVATITGKSNLKINDIIVVYSKELDEDLIKRVVGLPGDRIVIKDGQFYRNGNKIHENYIKEQDWGSHNSKDDVDLIVPDDCVYIMGDNRNSSVDSRDFGPVAIDQFRMKVVGSLSFFDKKNN